MKSSDEPVGHRPSGGHDVVASGLSKQLRAQGLDKFVADKVAKFGSRPDCRINSGMPSRTNLPSLFTRMVSIRLGCARWRGSGPSAGTPVLGLATCSTGRQISSLPKLLASVSIAIPPDACARVPGRPEAVRRPAVVDGLSDLSRSPPLGWRL